MPRFGNQETADAYHREVAAAKACQRVPYAVAPGFTLTTSRGAFEAGQEVKLADLDAPPHEEARKAAMRQLVDQGLVIKADHIPREVKGQIGVVASGRAITSKRGILGPGDGISKDDFDSATLENLVAKGLVVRS